MSKNEYSKLIESVGNGTLLQRIRWRELFEEAVRDEAKKMIKAKSLKSKAAKLGWANHKAKLEAGAVK